MVIKGNLLERKEDCAHNIVSTRLLAIGRFGHLPQVYFRGGTQADPAFATTNGRR